MKKLVPAAILLALSSASAASTSIFDIPWTNANKVIVMQKMKAAGFTFVREIPDECGPVLEYSGKLYGEVFGVNINFNKGTWAHTRLYVQSDLENARALFDVVRPRILGQYNDFQRSEVLGQIGNMKLWKSLGNKNNAVVNTEYGYNAGNKSLTYFTMDYYNSEQKANLWKCQTQGM